MYSVNIKVNGQVTKRIETKHSDVAYKLFYELLEFDMQELKKEYEDVVVEVIEENILLQCKN